MTFPLALLWVACHTPTILPLDTGDSGDGGVDTADSGDTDTHTVETGETRETGEPEDTATEEIPPATDPIAEMYDGSIIPEFFLTLSEESMAALDYDPDTYVPGTFQYGDKVLEGIGVRLKGQNSYQPLSGKAGFRLKFDAFDGHTTLYGLSDLTLNNMISDSSMMHERIAYTLYRAAGVPSSRSNQAALFLNGEFYGLMANTETPGKQLQSGWYEDEDGSLWELGDVDFYEGYQTGFLLEYGEEDLTLIQATIDAMEIPDADSAIEAVSKVFNYDEFLTFWAVGAVVGQFDGYPYTWPGDDAHVYADPTTVQLWMQPWGMDECLSCDTCGIESVNGVLATTCQKSASCRTQWRSRVWDILDLADDMDLAGMVEEVATQIQPYVERDHRKPFSNSEVRSGQAYVKDMLEDRQRDLESQIGPRP